MNEKIMSEEEYTDMMFEKYGMNTGISGIFYCRQIGGETYLFVEKCEKYWFFWKETFYRKQTGGFFSITKEYMKNDNLQIILARVKRYVEYIENTRKKGEKKKWN